MFAGNTRTKTDQGVYATDLFKREALKFVGQNSKQPWFLYLCFNAPHGASSYGPDEKNPKSGRPGVQAPAEYVAKYAEAKLADNLKRYYAAVTCMDDAIGEILRLIDQQGQTQNTLVLFQSDNGGSGNGGNAPLRGNKGTLWEGGLRVPCVAQWPAKIPGGRVSDEFLTTLELMPTFAAAAGTEVPTGLALDGYNMLPALAGQSPSPRKEMFWENRGQKAARIGNLKWIESERASGLYDLTSDLGESNDLSAKMPQRAAEIAARWTAWRKEMDQSEPRGPFRDY
jgi:arylsulfatase A-like enzyme